MYGSPRAPSLERFLPREIRGVHTLQYHPRRHRQHEEMKDSGSRHFISFFRGFSSLFFTGHKKTQRAALEISPSPSLSSFSSQSSSPSSPTFYLNQGPCPGVRTLHRHTRRVSPSACVSPFLFPLAHSRRSRAFFSSSPSTPSEEGSRKKSEEESSNTRTSRDASRDDGQRQSSPPENEGREGNISSFSSERTSSKEPLRPLTFLDEEVSMLREAVGRFAEEEIREKVLAMDDEGEIDFQIVEGLRTQGYLGFGMEEEQEREAKEEEGEGAEGGGSPSSRRQKSLLDSLIVLEEIAKTDPTISYLLLIQNLLINRCLSFYAISDKQRELLLPLISSEAMLGCFCLEHQQEEEKGREQEGEEKEGEEEGTWLRRRPLSVKAARIEEEGGEEEEEGEEKKRKKGKWLLNGKVSFVFAAPLSKIFVVFANIRHHPASSSSPTASSSSSSVGSETGGVDVTTAPSTSLPSGAAGSDRPLEDQDRERKEEVAVFLVCENAEGLEIGERAEKGGLKALPACEVVFNNVAVDDHFLLAKAEDADKLASILLDESRLGLAALMVGISKGALDVAVKYALGHAKKRRKVNQSIEDLLFGQMAMEIEACQLLTYNAALLRDFRKAYHREALLAKLFACKTAQKVSSACADLLGRDGLLGDFLLEKFQRDSKAAGLISACGRDDDGEANDGVFAVYRQYRRISQLMKKTYGKLLQES